jgi:fermentation-respiration switch protein FrsA (DUF1100 family)
MEGIHTRFTARGGACRASIAGGMNVARRKYSLTALVVSLCLAAAVQPARAQLTEAQLLHPLPGGDLAQEAVSAAAPAYRVTSHTITASDGTRLHAVLLRQPHARGTILYFGGNAYTIARFGAPTASIFAPLGVDLMIVDHRGYGMSEGVPTVASLESDGLAAFDYLAALPGVDRARILVHGQSLGSFTAGHVAAHREAAGVVLESSVTSTEDWVRTQMGDGITIAETLRGKGNLRYMAAIGEPLLLLVGAADRTTPASLSEVLYAASPLPPARKILAIIPGAGHSDVLGHPEAIVAYRRFLAVALP